MSDDMSSAEAMASGEMTEEEMEAWFADRSARKLKHLNSLDQDTKDKAIACIRRVRDALALDRTVKRLGVPEEEFDSYSVFLAPWERWMDIPLANEGHQNMLCQGIPIFPEVGDG